MTFFLRNTLYNIHKHFKASKIAIALQYCAWSPMIYEGVFVAAQDFRAHMIIFFLCFIEHLTENAKNDLCFGRKVQQLFHTHNALLPAVTHSFKTEANEIMHFFPTSLWPINTSWMLKLYIYIYEKKELWDFLTFYMVLPPSMTTPLVQPVGYMGNCTGHTLASRKAW